MSAITLLGVTQENYTYGTQVHSRHLVDTEFKSCAVCCDQPCLRGRNSCRNSHISARLLSAARCQCLPVSHDDNEDNDEDDDDDNAPHVLFRLL